MKLVNEHGYSIIRIYQEDVWYDKNNWKEKLQLAIKEYREVTNVFVGPIYETAKISTDHKYPTILITDKTPIKGKSLKKIKN